MRICSECGIENIDDAQFCRNCGVKLNQITSPKADVKPIDETKVIVSKNKNSIISKLFYKTDKYTNNLRFAKTKTISIVVFLFFFLLGIFFGSTTYSFVFVFFVAIIFGLIFAVPTFIIGSILGWSKDKLNH